MAKQVRIQVFPDGRIQAEVQGIKGKKCTDYIHILEEILDARAVDSGFTSEYYEVEQNQEWDIQQQKLEGM